MGPRGVGKTVTLREIADRAAERLSWPVIPVEASPRTRLLPRLVQRIDEVGHLLDGTTPRGWTGTRRRTRVAGGKVSAQVFGVGGEVRLEREPSDTVHPPSLAEALQATMDRAISRQAGLVLTIDELQAAEPDEVNLLAATLQATVPEDWPLVVVAAGLPGIRTTRGRRRLPT